MNVEGLCGITTWRRRGVPMRAIYAGAFDPITAGHLSVIQRAAPLFEELLVLVAIDPQSRCLFEPEERLLLIHEVCRPYPNVFAECTTRAAVDYARDRGVRFLIRGVRDSTDANRETLLARQNYLAAPEITTLFIPADAQLAAITSERLKALARQGAPLSRYCHPKVARHLRQRLGEQRAIRC